MKLYLVLIALTVCIWQVVPATGQEIQGGTPAATPSPAGIDVTVTSPAEMAAMDRVQAAYPGTLFYREGSQLTRLYGRTFEMGETSSDSAQRFLSANADLFGAEAADLLPTTPILPSGNTLPLMYEPETGTYKFTLIYHTQYRDGIPVFRSGVRTLVKNEAGYPLVWAGSGLKRLGQFHPDTTPRSAVDPATVAPEMTSFTAVEPVIWAGVDDKLETPVHAVTFEASNEGSGSSVPQRWLYVVDATTGEVLYKENRIVMTDVIGSVHGMATAPPKSDTCNPEVDTQMKYARVKIGTTTAYTNASGDFTIPNGGTSQVTVTSEVSGQYFTMNTMVGSLETLTMSVTPPGPANFMHNASNTVEAIRAQTNAYVEANRVRDVVLTYNPSYPTIPTQTNFPIYVNRSDGYCPGNAWYDPTAGTLNFCASGSSGGTSYPNTAYSNVVHHEYGHHLCQVAGTGQDQYGEGVGDSMAVCIADDPILGYGFTGDCNSGIRTADNTRQYPCTSDAHTCAQLLSGCVWSTRNQLQPAFPSTYLNILTNLMVNSIPMHAGSSTINPAIYTDWVTLDGGTSGAHFAQITAGFQAHNMVPATPPGNDLCANAVVVCPGTYTGTTSGAARDGSVSCDGSSPGPDVWYKYTPGSSGSATISLCSSSTQWDSVLSVHTASCPGTTEVGCNDDGCGGSATHGTLAVSVTGGTMYLIRVGGYASTNSGPFTLTISGPACASSDTTPPTPNPMTFASAPAPAGTDSITITATTATDATSPPVSYYFNFVSGGAGGNDSAWQTSTTYTDTGLTPNTSYTYRVKARDSATPTPNETGYSSNASAATLIETPTGVSFGTVTLSTIDLTATGTLTNLTTGSSGVYFDSTTTGGDAGINAWVQTTADTATGLSPNTSYTFQVKARNQSSVETAYSSTAAKATLIETPTGVSFGTVTANSIVLNAGGTFTNLTTGSSGLYFDSTTTGGDGGINAWVQATTDTATGLNPNTSYTFQVKARNQSSVETAYSPTAAKVTLANVPTAPTLSGATRTTLNLDVNANGNPAATEFAVMCTASSPTDSNWNGKYVNASGAASATAVWRTEAQWGVTTVQALQACTTYTFAVKARNSESVETVFGPGASLGTTGHLGDMDGDGAVAGDDIQSFITCAISGGSGCACANMTISAFVNCLLHPGT
ncbi:MAG TPA: fibronectin type III domain-containing protein, partial [Phycisphaerae bacterium]|nr:fibronectin type III domain-containing protein [Phycisphaerae bacterium]